MRKWVWVLMGIVVLSALFYVFRSNKTNGDLENLKTEYGEAA